MDMVITKSISRFARNTVTLLETVRELKLIGVDVYFEEQNIHSISADGELIKANPEWQFVAVYTDEGISATNTKHRDGFNRMVQDALDGKIEIKTAELIQFDFPLPQSFEG